MRFKVVVHEAEEGGFWGEVPAVPGCASQGETLDELLENIREALEGCLLADAPTDGEDTRRVLEVAI
jgi:predicted RNase H-like HicB family nuclease